MSTQTSGTSILAVASATAPTLAGRGGEGAERERGGGLDTLACLRAGLSVSLFRFALNPAPIRKGCWCHVASGACLWSLVESRYKGWDMLLCSGSFCLPCVALRIVGDTELINVRCHFYFLFINCWEGKSVWYTMAVLWGSVIKSFLPVLFSCVALVIDKKSMSAASHVASKQGKECLLLWSGILLPSVSPPCRAVPY